MLIHADADAFLASVEVRDDPRLADVPFAVAHQVVACASYAARARGVHAGLPVGRARRLCRDLVVVEPRDAAYEEASAALFALFRGVTTFVEPGSMEEAFLDVEQVGLDPVATARGLRARARAELGLPVSMGVGTTKLMAKVASRRAKPDGMLVISRTEDRAVRRALRLEEVWGVGPAKVEALRQREWRTVGDLVPLDIRDLTPVVGTMVARRLAAVAAGLDDARVRVPGERRSAAASRTIPATRTRSAVEAVWSDLLDAALGRLPAGVEVTRLDAGLRFEDGVPLTTTLDLRPAVTDPADVRGRAGAALAALGYEDDGRGVAFLSVGLACRPARVDPDQLELF